MAMRTTTATGSETQQLPLWAQQYYNEILGRGIGTLDEGYIPYGAPRIAGFAPEQEQAFELAQKGIGAGQSYLDSARARIGTGQSALAAASPYLTRAAEEKAMAATTPYLQAGTRGEGIGASLPYLTRAGGMSAAGAAQPYLGAGTRSFLEAATDYMNPYTQQVVDRIGVMAGRNLRENLLPEVNRTFVGSGTFGGKRSAEFTARALRDAQEAALAQQGKALQEGYGQAADIFGADVGRQLQAGQVAGQLTGADISAQTDIGRQLAAIYGDEAARKLTAGQIAGTVSTADINRLLGVGEAFGRFAGEDADRALRAAQLEAGMGEQAQRMGASDVAMLSGIGGQRQGLAQRSADLAYQDFLAQRGYPMQQLSQLSQLGSGMNIPMSSTTSSTASAPGPSTLQQIAGLGSTVIGGIGATGGFDQGGWARNLFGGGGGGNIGAGTAAPATGGNIGFAKSGGPIKSRQRKSGLGWLREIA